MTKFGEWMGQFEEDESFMGNLARAIPEDTDLIDTCWNLPSGRLLRTLCAEAIPSYVRAMSRLGGGGKFAKVEVAFPTPLFKKLEGFSAEYEVPIPFLVRLCVARTFDNE